MIRFDNRPLAKRPRRGFDNRLRALVPTLAQQIAAIMSGKVGVWFDASDLSTMYQDSAGTIPVTGVGQPVGLWLDKSQGSWLSTPVVAYSQSFGGGLDNWSGYQSTRTNDNGALKSVGTVAGSGSNVYRSIATNVTSSGLYKYSVKVKVDVRTVTQLRLVSQITSSPYTIITNAQNVIFTDSNEWKTLETYVYVNNPALGVQIGVITSVTVSGQLPTFWIDDVVVTKVHPSARHAFQNTATKRPILRQDAGGKYYLEADGVDDAMGTSTIPWVSSSLIAMCSYAKKATGNTWVFETSPSSVANNGAFTLGDQVSGILVRDGSGATNSVTTPENLTGLRIGGVYDNGVSFFARAAYINATSAPVAKADSLTPYSLNIFARNGNTSPYLKGFMYGLIVLNDTYSDANRILIEQYLAQQSGVTLP